MHPRTSVGVRPLQRLGNEERGGGKEIAQNGQGSRRFGDVAGQPKLTFYPEGISRSKQQMVTVGYISDTEEIVKASWSLCRHDGAASFKLSGRSPLPPAVSAKDVLGGRTQILDDC